ncbi:hypothetical protein EV424DRAFT_1542707 [Suillus variegatus]|nr:hypothetical protein EV424DRAFT_1542707 [Suillus variegatus]
MSGDHLLLRELSNFDLLPPLSMVDPKSITALHNGGFVIELESEILADWLCKPASKKALTGQLNNAVSFHTHTYPISTEYLQIQDKTFLGSVEQDNNLPANSITSIQWIKPPLHRSTNQHKPFALAHVMDPHMFAKTDMNPSAMLSVRTINTTPPNAHLHTPQFVSTAAVTITLAGTALALTSSDIAN